MSDATQDLERSRLIDHFKRAYQIVVGLAITLACTKLFATGFFKWPLDVSFWLFCAFFITVVPIFHGGDRSLDVKYLRSRPSGFWGRFWFIWDFYILLITAILFIKIAQAIPSDASPAVLPGSGAAAQAGPEHFYEWMVIMFAFDIFVLIVDGIKSNLFKTYAIWITLNLVLAIVCWWAYAQPGFAPHFSVDVTAIIVFAFAFVRTFLDYIFGGDFMFP
jgi:hypothetical protein